MSDWQPARIKPAHGSRLSEEETETLERHVVFVRPIAIKDIPPYIMKRRRGPMGCDAERFYVMRPDEDPLERGMKAICCEHEILTD